MKLIRMTFPVLMLGVLILPMLLSYKLLNVLIPLDCNLPVKSQPYGNLWVFLFMSSILIFGFLSIKLSCLIEDYIFLKEIFFPGQKEQLIHKGFCINITKPYPESPYDNESGRLYLTDEKLLFKKSQKRISYQ